MRLFGAPLRVSRVLLVAILLAGSGLLTPHAPPDERAARMADLRAQAAGSPRASDGPDGELSLSLEGPAAGVDYADAWERLAGHPKGRYLTEARLDGSGRLSGALWLYPSVCAPCTLTTHLTEPLEERGLVGVQYSYTSKDGEAFLRLAGDVDWEARFTVGALPVADPIGPLTALQSAPLAHEARWTPEGAAQPAASRSLEIPLLVSYEAAPGGAGLPPGDEASPPLYVLVLEEDAGGVLSVARVPLS